MKLHYCLSLMALILISCMTAMGSRYNYNLEVRNIGTESMSDGKVTSEKGFEQTIGMLVAKAGDTTAGPFKNSYADKWTVTWKTAEGKKISRTLDLTKAFNKPFEGRLVLTIDKDNNLAYFTEKFPGK
jgi:hypothetical protein